MIKLAVFDLDGTLLDNDTKLPKDFYENVKLLKENGIRVAISSARPVYSIFNILTEPCDDLFISAEDGNVFFRGRNLIKAIHMPLDIVYEIEDILKDNEDVAMLYTSVDNLYVSEKDHDRFLKWGLDNFVDKKPNPLTQDSSICKIHGYCNGGVSMASELINTTFSNLKDRLDILESGYGWFGIMEKGSNKAASVKFFMDHLNLTSDEVAVFGDSGNDVPMFQTTKNSYAMKNARDEIKKYANFVTEFPNYENGAMLEVLKFIK